MEASLLPEAWVLEDLQQQKLPARSLVSALRREGAASRLVDLNQGVPDIVAMALREPPRLILASILFADRVDEYLALMTALRTAGIGAHLALTGHLPALAANTFLKACPALDFVLCGEGERVARDLAECLGRRQAWEAVPGVVSRRPDLQSRASYRWRTDFASLASNLDSLPFPAYDTIPLFHGYGFATVEASRGCYHACAFCLPRAFYAARGAAYRSRSLASLVGEIEGLYRRGVRLFLFDDEQFLPPGRRRAGRVEALAEELARRDLRIAFTIKCRADDVEPGILQQLKEIGLIRVYVGIESGCQATLDLLGKQTTVQQNIDALATLDELGIVADWRSLAFHPWSTLEMLETESAFLQRTSAHRATIIDWREIEVYAGTPLAERLIREGRGDIAAWSIPYTIPDPRAELMRRMSRLVFCSDAYRRLCDAVTEAWFEVLLARRLGQNQGETEEAGLRSLVARANEESLKVWEEMLAFARTGDVYSADEVNARAGAWAERVNLTSYTSLAGRSSAPSPRRGNSGTSPLAG